MIQTAPATNGHKPEPQSWQERLTPAERDVIARSREAVQKRLSGKGVFTAAFIAKLADMLDEMEERVYLPY